MTGPGEEPQDVPPGFAPPPYGAPPPPPYGPGGYPPPYGPPQYPQQGIVSSDDQTWSLMAYIGQLAVGVIAPLVVYFARKDESPYVRFHGAQALNLALTYFIIFLGAIGIGIVAYIADAPIILLPAFLLIFVFAILHFIFLIIGAVKAGHREMYRLPAFICWPMVR
jgi:uncharacterized Tic20 family protein